MISLPETLDRVPLHIALERADRNASKVFTQKEADPEEEMVVDDVAKLFGIELKSWYSKSRGMFDELNVKMTATYHVVNNVRRRFYIKREIMAFKEAYDKLKGTRRKNREKIAKEMREVK